MTPREVIASATHIAAKLCRMDGLIGTTAPGPMPIWLSSKAPAGRPVAADRQGRHMPIIMRGGAFAKRKTLN